MILNRMQQDRIWDLALLTGQPGVAPKVAPRMFKLPTTTQVVVRIQSISAQLRLTVGPPMWCSLL